MNDLLEIPPTPPANQGPTTTAPPVPPPPGPTDEPPHLPRRRSGWRFVGGVAAGAVLTLIAGGGIFLATRGDDSIEPAEKPPETTVIDDAAGTIPTSVHDLVVAVRPSIAAIHTTVTQTDIFGRSLEGEAAGTGFVLSADGYILTNNHVIDGAVSISVTLADGATEDAELVAADPRSDLAVLHIDRDDLRALPIGDSDAIQVGDPVVAIGNALDLGGEPTVTGGMISAKSRTITEPNGQVLVDLVQTDAAISPGNSGGPLIDMQGRVVGINTAVAGQGQNIGFAISINPAKALIDQLRNGQVPRHALMGVSTRSYSDADTAGAQVMSVEPGSGAEAAGIVAGDVITNVAGDDVGDSSDLVAAIARHQPGDKIEVTVWRNGNEKTLSVVLGAHDETSS